MSFRPSQLFIQSRTKQRLRLIAELFPTRSQNSEAQRHTEISEGVCGNASADEIGDKLLNDAIAREFPEILMIEKEIADVKKEAARRVRDRGEPSITTLT